MSPQRVLMETTNKSDHDLLLIAVTRLTDLGVKVDSLEISFRSQVNELKDGIHAQLNDHEARIKLIERMVDQIDPPSRMVEGRKMREDLNNLGRKVEEREVANKIYQRWWGIIITLVAASVSGFITYSLRK